MLWGHSRYQDGDERWSGAFETREEAITDGRATYDDDVFWVQGGVRPEASSFMPDADDIIEDMANRAVDNAGDVAEDWPDVSKEARAELDALLSTWAEKHVAVKFWIAAGEPERIEAEVPVSEGLSPAPAAPESSSSPSRKGSCKPGCGCPSCVSI